MIARHQIAKVDDNAFVCLLPKWLINHRTEPNKAFMEESLDSRLRLKLSQFKIAAATN